MGLGYRSGREAVCCAPPAASQLVDRRASSERDLVRWEAVGHVRSGKCACLCVPHLTGDPSP